MSRVLFVSLDESQVVAKCHAAKVGISVIESLPGGGVRLVCSSSDGAARMTRTFKSHLMDQSAERQRHRPATPLW
jgi:hypothetical protein